MESRCANRGRRGLRRRLALGLALGAAVAGPLAAPRVAGAVSVTWAHLDPEGNHLEIRIDGTDAEVNDIRVTEDAEEAVIWIREANEANEVLSSGGLCTAGTDLNTVECRAWVNSTDPRVTLRVTMRDGDDRYTGPPTRYPWTAEGQPIIKSAVVRGGPGNDVLEGGRWPSEIYGGPGSDVLEAGDVGGNVLVGGTEFDLLRAANGHPDALVMCGQEEAVESTDGRAVVDGNDPDPERCSTVGPHVQIAFTDTEEYASDPVPGFSFEGGFDEPLGGTECRIDGGDWSAGLCTPSLLSFADGPHVFEVQAMDIAGIWAPPAVHEWTVDTIPPAVTLGSGPGDGPGAIVGTTDASFEWDLDDATPTATECRRYAEGEEPPAWEPCSAPKGYSDLGDATHTFEVGATDAAGNRTVEAYEWTVDTVPPELDVDGFGSKVLTNDPRPKLPSLSSPSDNLERFECRADGEGSWHECASGERWPGPELADGERSIGVRAVSIAGIATPPEQQASQAYLIDTAAPAVSFDAGQDPNDAGGGSGQLRREGVRVRGGPNRGPTAQLGRRVAGAADLRARRSHLGAA